MSSMSCSQAREAIWPDRRPKLLDGPIEEAQLHVAGCAACRDYLAQNHALWDSFEELRAVKAPIALRERVIAAIAEERARLGDTDPHVSSGRTTAPRPQATERRSGLRGVWSVRGAWREGRAWKVSVVAAAAIAAGVFIARASLSTDEGHAASSVFVEDYLRRAVGQEQIHTTDPATVREWLTRELGIALKPLQMAGLEIEGAEICLLEGRRGAMIVYVLDGTRISHYLVPREGVKERAPTIGRAAADQEGLFPPLVTWSTVAVEQALMGDLPSARLLEVARASY